MTLPGTPMIRYDDSHSDTERAAWMLSLIDASPDRLAWIAVPRADSDEQLDAIEAKMIAAYEIAKAQRPDLAVRLVPKVLDVGGAHGMVALHEHKWVGGSCINGCGETRAA